MPWPLAPAAPDAAVTPLPRARLGQRGPAPAEEARAGQRGRRVPLRARVVPAEPRGLGRGAGGLWAPGEGRARGWLRESGIGAAESRSLPLPAPREVQQLRSDRRLEHNSVY